MNPWLETWLEHEEVFRISREDETYAGHEIVIWVKAKSPNVIAQHGERGRLAVAAPALVRALLSVEWIWKEGRPYHSCPECDADARDGDHPWWTHRPGCCIDAALTSAGLPDQESRDAARGAIADATIRARFASKLPDLSPPRPEFYDELIAAGTWPMSVSKEMAAAYWRDRDKREQR